MATWTTGYSVDMTTVDLTPFYFFTTSAQTSTSWVINSFVGGLTLGLYGNNFTFQTSGINTGPLSGTVGTMTYGPTGGAPIWSITGASFPLTTVASTIYNAKTYSYYTGHPYEQQLLGAILAGDDSLYAGAAGSHLLGYGGNDLLVSTAFGRSTLEGGDGNDTITASDVGDLLIGGNGNDSLVGGNGADTLYGDLSSGYALTGGNDVLIGGGGNDSIFADLGRDTVDGGGGNDTIDVGYSAIDSVDGGFGLDTVVVHANRSYFTYTHSGQTLVFSNGSRFNNVEFFTFDDGTVDYNALGAATLPSTTLEGAGATALVRVGEKYQLVTGGTAVTVKYQASDLFVGQLGAAEPVAAEAYGSGYLAVWQPTGGGTYTWWLLDATGNHVRTLATSIGGTSAAFKALETALRQDLNGDGASASPGTSIEAAGATQLSVDTATSWYRMTDIAAGATVYLQYNNAMVAQGSLGAWTAIAAESVAGGYDIAWKNPQTGQYTVWSVDDQGSRTGALTGIVTATDAGLQALETTFQQDLNGDGTIGLVINVIETAGSTSLVQVAGNYALRDGSGSGPTLKYAGSPVVVGQFAGWAPIAAEILTGGGYEVAWKNAASGLYSVWLTDATGTQNGSALGAVPGTDAGLQALELGFHQDLNGDGSIGLPLVVVENLGVTQLTRLGPFFELLDAVGNGPTLRYAGSNVVAGQFGSWTPIGAEAVTGGYEVAWKDAASGLYSVWLTDAAGNHNGNALGAVPATDAGLQALELSFHQDLNGDGTIGLPVVVLENLGVTQLTRLGPYFELLDGSGNGPTLRYAGSNVVAGQFGGWTPIGAEAVTGGYEVAWKDAASGLYSVWLTDAAGNHNGNALGAVPATDAGLEALEVSFQQDLNGDGTIGLVINTIESAGSTSLVQVGSNYALRDGSGNGPTLKYAGSAVVAGQFGAWAPVGAEAVSGGYEVAWKNAAAGLYSVWLTDAAGNQNGSALGAVAAGDGGLQALETTFHQDLNGDGAIGLALVTIEGFGATQLARLGPYFELLDGSGNGPLLKYAGSNVVAGQFGSWAPIGAEAVTGGYEVAWKDAASGLYSVWLTDAAGNHNGNALGAVPATDAGLQALEVSFQQDLNSDGTIGQIVTVIESAGSTSLVQVGSNYALRDGSGNGPTLKYAGSAVVAGQFGSWTPIGAEARDTGGYGVAWKDSASGHYSVWLADAAGNFSGIALGSVAGDDEGLASQEVQFHQDLNGDGTIGTATVVLESYGATQLTRLGPYFELLDASGNGPFLKFGNAFVVAGRFGTWAPIGAEALPGGGYEVAWKDAATGLFTAWLTDTNGAYIGNAVDIVPGTSSGLQALEVSFQQDLNGDGHLGIWP